MPAKLLYRILEFAIILVVQLWDCDVGARHWREAPEGAQQACSVRNPYLHSLRP